MTFFDSIFWFSILVTRFYRYKNPPRMTLGAGGRPETLKTPWGTPWGWVNTKIWLPAAPWVQGPVWEIWRPSRVATRLQEQISLTYPWQNIKYPWHFSALIPIPNCQKRGNFRVNPHSRQKHVKFSRYFYVIGLLKKQYNIGRRKYMRRRRKL